MRTMDKLGKGLSLTSMSIKT